MCGYVVMEGDLILSGEHITQYTEDCMVHLKPILFLTNVTLINSIKMKRNHIKHLFQPQWYESRNQLHEKVG